jgi:hypothetical protein
MAVAVVGSLGSGVRIIGPFKTQEDAIAWCEENVMDQWEVMLLEAKESY